MTDSLFSSDKDWHNNACVNWSHAPFSLYTEGYKKAGDYLVQQVVEGSSEKDILVYPIAFLYRQYIELQLKDIIRESRILLEEQGDFPTHHKLRPIWELANVLMKKIIRKIDPTVGDYITDKDLKVIQRIISAFYSVDPDSFAFRYPEDKDGNQTLLGLTHINLRKLAEQIDVLKEQLGVCRTYRLERI